VYFLENNDDDENDDDDQINGIKSIIK